MDGTKILTSQNVILNLNSQVLRWRVLAYILDLIIIGAYVYLFYKVAENYNYDFAEESRFTLFAIIGILPVFTYTLLTEFLLNGRTIGKYVCGIRVVKINGLKCGFTEYLLRWLFRMIDIYPTFFLSFFFQEYGMIGNALIGIPAFIMIATSKNNQRLGDRVAGTTVIKIKNKASLSSTIFKEIEHTYVPTFPEVVKLSDNDMRIIQENYKEATKNRNYDVLQSLRNKVEEVMGVRSKMINKEFLETVIKDFNHYTQNM